MAARDNKAVGTETQAQKELELKHEEAQRELSILSNILTAYCVACIL